MRELTLDEVLEEYAAATPNGNDLKVLRTVTETYPQYATDLADFAAARAIIKHAPNVELSAEEEVGFRESGLKGLRAVLNTFSNVHAEQRELPSLIEIAKSKGFNRSKFAYAVGLSISLIQYLEKRRLEFSTIPPKIIALIAEVLETGEDLVENYLNQEPVSTANASYKASERPREIKPKSFAEAVREDQQLSGEEKRRLLEL